MLLMRIVTNIFSSKLILQSFTKLRVSIFPFKTNCYGSHSLETEGIISSSLKVLDLLLDLRLYSLQYVKPMVYVKKSIFCYLQTQDEKNSSFGFSWSCDMADPMIQMSTNLVANYQVLSTSSVSKQEIMYLKKWLHSLSAIQTCQHKEFLNQ